MDSSDGTPVGTMLEGIMAKFRAMRCEDCGTDMMVPATFTGSTCRECDTRRTTTAKRNDEVKSIMDRADRALVPWLQAAGMDRRETTALAGKIPAELGALLRRPELCVNELIDGKIPTHGFGLTGPAGRGKTFALAAIFKQCALTRWKRRHGHEGRAATTRWMEWCKWPARVNALRIMSTKDDGLRDAAVIVKRMCEVPVLVLDDLGAERISKGYLEDWATSQLDLIVDHRHSAMLPTWYTTNLQAKELVERYGARMVSRLASENIMAQCPGGPDLRTTWGTDGAQS